MAPLCSPRRSSHHAGLRFTHAFSALAAVGCLAGCAAASGRSARLADDQYVASCIGLGEVVLDPPASLCVGTLDGSVEGLGVQMTPGVSPALSHDRSQIALVDGNRLRVVDTTGKETISIDGQVGLVSIRWLPDGSGLIVQRRLDDDHMMLERLDLAGPKTTVLAESDELPGRLEEGISLSPDGTRLAYATELGGAWALRILDLTTLEQDTLFSSEQYVYAPSWSPDGDHIAAVVGLLIETIDVRDGSHTITASTGRDVTTPSWSPSGDGLLFVDSRGAVAVVTPGDITSVRPIVDQTAPGSGGPFPALPTWS